MSDDYDDFVDGELNDWADGVEDDNYVVTGCNDGEWESEEANWEDSLDSPTDGDEYIMNEDDAFDDDFYNAADPYDMEYDR